MSSDSEIFRTPDSSVSRWTDVDLFLSTSPSRFKRLSCHYRQMTRRSPLLFFNGKTTRWNKRRDEHRFDHQTWRRLWVETGAYDTPFLDETFQAASLVFTWPFVILFSDEHLIQLIRNNSITQKGWRLLFGFSEALILFITKKLKKKNMIRWCLRTFF